MKAQRQAAKDKMGFDVQKDFWQVRVAVFLEILTQFQDLFLADVSHDVTLLLILWQIALLS